MGLAGAWLLALAGTGLAATQVDCSSIHTTLATNAPSLSGQVLIKGTCTGDIFFTNTTVSIVQDGAGGEIDGAISMSAANVTISNMILNGAGADNQGIQLDAGAPGFAGATPSVPSLNNVTLENYPDSGVSVHPAGGTVFISGGTISGNKNCGLFLNQGAHAQIDATVFTGNGTDPTDTEAGDQCGIHLESGATADLTNVTIDAGPNGPALWIFQAAVNAFNPTMSAAATIAYPAIVVKRGSLNLNRGLITGSGHSNAIFASAGSAIEMQNAEVTQSDANDATILIADGSSLVSLGGNQIINGAASGIAISATNAATFHQVNETSLGIPIIAGDEITGAATVQMQSNMELGIGNAAPLSWNGSITVAQNSSFRLDGGTLISGSVTISQGSNGFFNTSATGSNTVSGGVKCSGSTSHVVGANKVTPNVTIVTTGTGCYSF